MYVYIVIYIQSELDYHNNRKVTSYNNRLFLYFLLHLKTNKRKYLNCKKTFFMFQRRLSTHSTQVS